MDDFEEPQQALAFERQPRRRSGYSLRVLLEQYNSMLGWSQKDLAEALGRDTSWLSKIFGGKSRPFDATLEAIAEAYRRAGLEGITADILIEARDRADDPAYSSSRLPDPWTRLVLHVLAMPTDVQDSLYRQFSLMVSDMAHIVTKYRANAPSDD